MAKNILYLIKNVVVQRPNWSGSSCVQAIKNCISPWNRAAEHKMPWDMIPVLW